MDDTQWHKFRLIFPRRKIDGEWTSPVGQVWRRRGTNGKWQYKQDEETDEEYLARLW